MQKRSFITHLLCCVLVAGALAASMGPVQAQTNPVANPLIIRTDGATLHAQPGGAPLDTLAVGAIVTPTGRTLDQQWIAVQTRDGLDGWIAGSDLIGFELANLPVVEDDTESSRESVPVLAERAESVPSTLDLVTPEPVVPTATATAAVPPVPASTQATAAAIMDRSFTLGIIGAGGANLLDAPGGTAIARLGPGQMLQVTARTGDAAWVRGASTEDQTLAGWIDATQLYLADVSALPVIDQGSTQAANDAIVLADNSDAAQGPATSNENAEAQAALPVASDQVQVNTDGERLNIRSGPGTTYAVTAKAQDGERYRVLARNQESSWLQIDTTSGYAAQYGMATGWVSAAYVDFAGEVETLPIADSDAATAVSLATPEVTPAQQTITNNENSASTGESGLAGTLVFQSSPGGMIYAHDLSSGATWTLTNGFDPAISPDGQTVTFVRNGGENGIYLIDIDGSNERRIYSGNARLSSPKWSPDGAWILFTRGDEFTECYRLGPGGCIAPDSLPEGFEVDGDIPLSRVYDYSLARVDPNGDNYRDIVALSSARAADWNEAGIVYQSDAGLQITADLPDAANQLVLFDYLKPYYVDPDWQPNGGRIAYMGKEASHWEIFVVNPDGSDRTALTHPSTTLVDEIPSNVAPSWSPDGEQIIFLSNRTDSSEAGAWRLWVMDADGSNQRPLAIDAPITYTFGAEQSVSWALASR